MYQLTIIQFPSGKYGYVGSIPLQLGSEIRATRSDIMGGRAFRNGKGEIVTIKFPSFETREDAQLHMLRLEG